HLPPCVLTGHTSIGYRLSVRRWAVASPWDDTTQEAAFWRCLRKRLMTAARWSNAVADSPVLLAEAEPSGASLPVHLLRTGPPIVAQAAETRRGHSFSRRAGRADSVRFA